MVSEHIMVALIVAVGGIVSAWITRADYLIREKMHERNIHGLGFSGVDEISAE
jgi:hypothetical protein